MSRELLKSDHGLGAFDAVEPGQVVGDHLGEVVMLPYANDGDEVPLASDGVNLGHTLDSRQVGTSLIKPSRLTLRPPLKVASRARPLYPYLLYPYLPARASCYR
jgi:hypothetical protein